MEGSVGALSKELLPVLASKDPPYKEAFYWLQFAFICNTKGQYAAPSHTALALSYTVEGEPLFLLALYHLQNLYPRSYARVTKSTSEGVETVDLDVKLITRTYPGATGLYSSLGGGDTPPTKP